jgi:hypothetical protein
VRHTIGIGAHFFFLPLGSLSRRPQIDQFSHASLKGVEGHLGYPPVESGNYRPRLRR